MIARLVFVASCALGLFMASPAMASETGQCLPAQQVRSDLAAQGMQPIIVGNRAGYGHPTALIFFADADGNGVAVASDKPLGQQGETACIESVYSDVRLNDITRPGIPAWAAVAVVAARARAACEAGKLGYQEQCLPSDESLSNLESHGAHVMLMAVGTAINPRDKSIRHGQRLIVAVSPADNKGIVKATTPDGASYMLSAYTSAAYTPAGDKLLRAR